MRKLFYGLCIIALTGVSGGCSDTCNENRSALPTAGFYYSGAESADLVTLDSLEVIGVNAPSDSVLSPASEQKNELYLPFRIDSDTTQYVFVDAHKLSGLRDTVTFVYTRTPRIVNLECGVSYLYDIRSISAQGVLIDSVTCPQGFIDNAAGRNINIYFDATRPE